MYLYIMYCNIKDIYLFISQFTYINKCINYIILYDNVQQTETTSILAFKLNNCLSFVNELFNS